MLCVFSTGVLPAPQVSPVLSLHTHLPASSSCIALPIPALGLVNCYTFPDLTRDTPSGWQFLAAQARPGSSLKNSQRNEFFSFVALPTDCTHISHKMIWWMDASSIRLNLRAATIICVFLFKFILCALHLAHSSETFVDQMNAWTSLFRLPYSIICYLIGDKPFNGRDWLNAEDQELYKGIRKEDGSGRISRDILAGRRRWVECTGFDRDGVDWVGKWD